MTKILIGFLIGLIVGWNMFPQPAIVKRAYDWTKRKVWEKVSGLFTICLLVTLSGCVGQSDAGIDTGHARERAMAEIAIVSVTADSPIPDDELTVGDDCPVCNDPPGACGVGKTGDGRNCDVCMTCKGDGKIDETDVQQSPKDRSVVEVPKEITLHMTEKTRSGWPSKWYAENRSGFIESGWEIRLVLDPVSTSDIAYFDVVAPNGEVFQFFEPITIADVRHLETRR